MIQRIFLLVACFYYCSLSYFEISRLAQTLSKSEMVESEALYLPNIKAVKALSFGYTNFLADVLWFNTISYFGKHYRSDREYRWLAHMCDLVTDLDPEPTYYFEFCSMMLAWEANLPDKGVGLLTKATQAHPDNWYFHYLKGFIQMFFLKDNSAARDEFIAASKMPDAPAFTARLAAKQIASLNDPSLAIEFLSEMIKNTKDESARHVLKMRLNEIKQSMSR